MQSIAYYEASDFTLKKVLSLKKHKKIFVIFSTFGGRESLQIYNKIILLRSTIGEIIDKIFLSHRRMEKGKEDITESKAREAGNNVEVLICNSIKVPDMGDEAGKGADMRRTLYTINKFFKGTTPGEDIVLVFLDSDVLPEYFGGHFVLSLAGAVLVGSDFAKASFRREQGRATKYAAQPLFSLIDHPALREMTKFAYPLSGEAAGCLGFFNSVNFWQGYGVETGIAMDACFGDYKISDVNLGLYDHAHHPDPNIQKMSFSIMRTYFLKLLEYGIIELKDNAKIGNAFQANYISEDAKRQVIDLNIEEKKYEPLEKII